MSCNPFHYIGVGKITYSAVNFELRFFICNNRDIIIKNASLVIALSR